MQLSWLQNDEKKRILIIYPNVYDCRFIYQLNNKYKTIIGDRVMVGSDTTLVAPVTIHDDVYIATATTVRQDVPAGALVYNAREEKIKEGWTAKRQAKIKK